MIALAIILPHLLGDYVLQNDWMAQEKTKRWLPAFVHGAVYTLAYALFWVGYVVAEGVPIGQFLLALLIIGATHMVIDHWRLAKVYIWAFNQLVPSAYRYTWTEAKLNGGYSKRTPAWMSTWLMVIVDNTLHLLINTAAILLLVWH